MNPQNLNLTKAAYSVKELIELLPLGRNSLYEAVKSGTLKATKYGKRTMFLAPHITEFLVSLPQAASKDANRVGAGDEA